MFSVTKRIDFITQPHGGYVDPKKFKTIELIPFERTKNIPSAYKPIQGLAVDYLTRFMSGFSKEEAFKISLLGADAVFENDEAKKLLENIKGLDRQSITSACKLVCYDTAYRVGPSAYTPSFREEVEEDLILNISILVKRALSFFKDYGPIAKCGFTFEGGYSEIVSSGDGDFLTNDTLWDFKVSEKPLSSKQTLQLLIYYILGHNSIHKEFKKIKKLGIFNPLLNTVYQLDISEISNETFHVVSRYVLGYDISDEPKCWHTTYREGEYVKTDKNILLEAKMQIQRGIPLSSPIRSCGLFPSMVIHMIGIGEETGNLEEMLDNVARYFEEEVEVATQEVTALMEPLIIVVMAVVVGALIMAIYSPMMKLYSDIG